MRLKEKDGMVIAGVCEEKRVLFILEWKAVMQSIAIETVTVRTMRVFGDCWEDWILYGTVCDWRQQYECSVELV